MCFHWTEFAEASKHLPALLSRVPILDRSASPSPLSKVIKRPKCFVIITTASDAFAANTPIVIKQSKAMNQMLNLIFTEVKTAHGHKLSFWCIGRHKITG